MGHRYIYDWSIQSDSIKTFPPIILFYIRIGDLIIIIGGYINQSLLSYPLISKWLTDNVTTCSKDRIQEVKTDPSYRVA